LGDFLPLLVEISTVVGSKEGNNAGEGQQQKIPSFGWTIATFCQLEIGRTAEDARRSRPPKPPPKPLKPPSVAAISNGGYALSISLSLG